MNRFKTIILALSIGLNLAFGSVWLIHVLNKDNGCHLKSNGLNQPSPIHEKINVSAEQWEQISPLVEDFKEATQIQGNELNSLRCRLLDLMQAPVLDENRVKIIREELYKANLDMKRKAIDLLLKEKKILEPHQYKALISEIRQRSNCAKIGGRAGGSFMRVLRSDPAVSPGQAASPNRPPPG